MAPCTRVLATGAGTSSKTQPISGTCTRTCTRSGQSNSYLGTCGRYPRVWSRSGSQHRPAIEGSTHSPQWLVQMGHHGEHKLPLTAGLYPSLRGIGPPLNEQFRPAIMRSTCSP
ncbi:hypothetical protein PCASD_12798 [Puccinia coronata f. sp. avenae]|uniref:Uncharacterized protein n=1 Tax=Puccinia coronata f. sp. avenae TaxID=200324 RepID=A0A2N5UVZ3_9BASI|nr:hypothetical protein PCASD_12798 [Puccinia coronata f. sp. avenae]